MSSHHQGGGDYSGLFGSGPPESGASPHQYGLSLADLTALTTPSIEQLIAAGNLSEAGQRARSELEAPVTPSRAEDARQTFLHLTAGHAALAEFDVRTACTHLEQARELLERRGEAESLRLAEVLGDLSWAHRLRGDRESSESLLLEAGTRLAEAPGLASRQNLQLCRLFCDAATRMRTIGDLEGARGCLALAGEVAGALPAHELRDHLRYRLLETDLALDQRDPWSARAHLSEAEHILGRLADRALRDRGLVDLRSARISLVENDLPEVTRVIGSLFSALETPGHEGIAAGDVRAEAEEILGLVARRQGDGRSALQHFDEAIGIGRLLNVDSTTQARFIRQAAGAAHDLGEPELEERYRSAAITLARQEGRSALPTLIDALEERRSFYQERLRWARAEHDASQVIELLPGLPWRDADRMISALMIRGAIRSNVDQHAGGEQDLRQALALTGPASAPPSPLRVQLHLHLAILLANQERLSEALAEQRIAQRLAERLHDEKPTLVISTLLAQVDTLVRLETWAQVDKTLAAARQHLEAWSEPAPELRAQYHYLAARRANHRQEFEEGIAHLEAAIRLHHSAGLGEQSWALAAVHLELALAHSGLDERTGGSSHLGTVMTYLDRAMSCYETLGAHTSGRFADLLEDGAAILSPYLDAFIPDPADRESLERRLEELTRRLEAEILLGDGGESDENS